MIPKRFETIEEGAGVTIERFVGKEDRSEYGAFRRGETVRFRVSVARALGCGAAVMRIGMDGEEPSDVPMDFEGLKGDRDLYTCALKTDDETPPEGGLLRYEFLLLRGGRTLFTNSRNNVDFTLAEHNANRFRMLVYRSDFEPPEWFRKGTMYHIFLDRFRKGEGEAKLHGGRLETDWENGVPQYAPHPGEELANDVFFGGNLQGVCEKMDFLQSLGVTVLYLSPVFRAASNHRYDTGDYEEIDSLLGGERAFRELIREAHERGMKVVLDGVFNHTGDDSKYFNRRGNYPTVGAYQSEKSEYAGWYRFRSFPDDYECWWGIRILPRLNHENATCRAFFTGKDGIGAKWIRAGADGWRLDVADELSDQFLDEFRETVKQAGGEKDPLILGEVWENAADKIAYGKLRRYLWGGQLDSVMNYPFRNAVLALLREGDSRFFKDTLKELYASYPRAVSDCLMNLLGTHDTPRILTVLGDPTEGGELDNHELAVKKLTTGARRRAKRLLMIGATVQFTVFGVPSVYYGDEAGLEGYRDPFCRMPYPWGREDRAMLAHYRKLGAMRRRFSALQGGDFRFLESPEGTVVYERSPAKKAGRTQKNDREPDRSRLVVAVNAGKTEQTIRLPRGCRRQPILTVGKISGNAGGNRRGHVAGGVVLPPHTCAVFRTT